MLPRKSLRPGLRKRMKTRHNDTPEGQLDTSNAIYATEASFENTTKTVERKEEVERLMQEDTRITGKD